jgi:hypothetical protein
MLIAPADASPEPSSRHGRAASDPPQSLVPVLGERRDPGLDSRPGFAAELARDVDLGLGRSLARALDHGLHAADDRGQRIEVDGDVGQPSERELLLHDPLAMRPDRALGALMERARVALDRPERPGQRLGVISDPFGALEEQVLATLDGVVIGQTRLPLVNEGDALFHIARFEAVGAAADEVDATSDPIETADAWLPEIDPPNY